MAEQGHPKEPPQEPEDQHPRGTLAVMLIYMSLFVFGWLALYLFEFLPRGAPRP